MRPSKMLLAYGEALFPGANYMWKNISRGGHHEQAMAYCRIGEQGSDWIVDNLQTDSDVQGLSSSERSVYERVNEMVNSGIYQIRDGKWHFKSGKQFLPLSESNAPHTLEQIQEAQAYSFWNRTTKHWPVMMLHVAKALAKADGKSLYVSSDEMQKQKWSTIPERSKDVYDRFPRMMGGEEVEWKGKPEDLREQDWDVVQVAEIQAIIKTAQQKGLNLEVLSKWFFTVGGSPKQFSDALKNNQLASLANLGDKRPPNPKIPVVGNKRLGQNGWFKKVAG